MYSKENFGKYFTPVFKRSDFELMLSEAQNKTVY